MKHHRLNFYLQNDGRLKGDEKPVMAYLRYYQKLIHIGTGVKVKPIEWDEKAQRCKVSKTYNTPRNVQLQAFNSALDAIESLIYAGIAKLYQTNTQPTHDEMKKFVKSYVSRKGDENFVLPYLEKFIADHTDDLQPKSLSSYRIIYNHISSFNPNLKFDDLTLESAETFYDYLVENNISANSLNLYFTLLKNIYKNFCIESQRPPNLQFLNFKAPKIETRSFPLSEIELQKLESIATPPKLQKLYFAFLFSCYTGFRKSDILQLQESNFVEQNGKYHFTKVIQKTKQILQLPIRQKAYECFKSANFSFKGINAQQLPLLLKQAGINDLETTTRKVGQDITTTTRPRYEVITFHDGRATFATISLIKGLSPEVIMQFTGHKTRSAFEKYINLSKIVATTDFSKVYDD